MILVSAKRTNVDDRNVPDLAARWQAADGFPPEIAQLLKSHEGTRSATMLLGVPEHRVRLAGGARAAQTDLWALARTTQGLLSIVVDQDGAHKTDALARESPSASVHEQTDIAVRSLLEIDRESELAIGSQFFHRTACALIEARRFFATGAAVIVHSFSGRRESFLEFQSFVALLNGLLRRPGELVRVPPREGIDLYFGWVDAPLGRGL